MEIRILGSCPVVEPPLSMIDRTCQPADGTAAQRLHQQELIASFAAFALRADRLEPVLQEACRLASQGLRRPLAKVLEYIPAEDVLLIRAGIGWHPGTVGVARLGADLESPAGFAFKTGQSVLSNNLADENRFRTPRLLLDHGVKRAFNVPISVPDRRYGVLEVDAPDGPDFEVDDTSFLETLASLLAHAIARDAQQRAIEADRAFAQDLLESSSDCVKVLDLDGTVAQVNGNGLCLLEMDGSGRLLGRGWETLWPVGERPKVEAALVRARAGLTARFEGQCPTFKGQDRWWEVEVRPVLDGTGLPRRLIAISRDVTERRRASEAKDLLMLEVHHRVKNSLQLVQNLLTLQARSTQDERAAAQLNESASRVHTIGAIHDRLYRTGTALKVEVGPYLEGLVEDLRAGIASTLKDRLIIVRAEGATWPAADMPALGLVLTELVTNALKYGRGMIRISFTEPAGSDGVLVVEDEGCDLSVDFDPSRGRGLGMRLVNGLLRGEGAGLSLDRSVGHTRFIARLPPTRTEG